MGEPLSSASRRESRTIGMSKDEAPEIVRGFSEFIALAQQVIIEGERTKSSEFQRRLEDQQASVGLFERAYKDHLSPEALETAIREQRDVFATLVRRRYEEGKTAGRDEMLTSVMQEWFRLVKEEYGDKGGSDSGESC